MLTGGISGYGLRQEEGNMGTMHEDFDVCHGASGIAGTPQLNDVCNRRLGCIHVA